MNKYDSSRGRIKIQWTILIKNQRPFFGFLGKIQSFFREERQKQGKMKKRIRERGIIIGRHSTGPLNKITDVAGVKVGHCTIDTEDHKTGVTVILPCEDNMFANKLTAAAYVHNGFGKTTGIPQIAELGTLETPIALTNTLCVGKIQDALVGYMAERCRADNIPVRSVNAVVGECNDASLNKISDRCLGERELRAAIGSASADFEEGDVGAGKGTTCFGMKGGIGSASRRMTFGGETYTVGVLVQSNFGSTENFLLNGKAVGAEIKKKIEAAEKDEGSIMMVIATDLPVSDRQLARIIRRAGVGLARCGSYMGHGSGDIMIGFTTANRIPDGEGAFITVKQIRESLIDEAFEAVAEATEEAVLNSLAMADTVTGYKGRTRYCLTDLYFEDSPSEEHRQF